MSSELNDVLVRALEDESRREVCPCEIADKPCNQSCPCANLFSPGVCACCVKHGSAKQRQEKANWIVETMASSLIQMSR